MDKTTFFKLAAVIFFLSILFTPQNSNAWLYLFIPGLIFGILWFWKLG
jgi:hypothetical protein